MRTIFLILVSLFTWPSLAEVRITFYGDITPKTLLRLNGKIEKAAANLRKDEERILVLDLDSGGGNLYAALDFVESIKEKTNKLNVGLHTRVRSTCESSCTVLFTAGEKRIAGKRSKFGFHSPDVVSRLPRGIRRLDVLEEARDKWLIAVSKVDPRLAIEIESRALLLDDEMFYLDGKDLLTGYVTELVR